MLFVCRVFLYKFESHSFGGHRKLSLHKKFLASLLMNLESISIVLPDQWITDAKICMRSTISFVTGACRAGKDSLLGFVVHFKTLVCTIISKIKHVSIVNIDAHTV